jgi:hypothetical protein
VAADDWLYPECIEKMVGFGEEHPNVSIVGAYVCRGTTVEWHGLPCSIPVVPGRDVCRTYLLGGLYVFGSPTSLLYRSEIVRSRAVFFNESNLHADSEACLEFLEHSDFGFVHQILAFSRSRDDSLTSFSRSFNTYLPYGLYILIKYGPRYLDETQVKRRIREKLNDYYGYLGAQVFKWRGAKFWNFHRQKLAELGNSLSMRRLVSSAIAYIMKLMLNPMRTFEEAAQRVKERRSIL